MMGAEIAELSAYLDVTSSTAHQLAALQKSMRDTDAEWVACNSEIDQVTAQNKALALEVDIKRKEYEEAVKMKEEEFANSYSYQMYVASTCSQIKKRLLIVYMFDFPYNDVSSLPLALLVVFFTIYERLSF